MINYNENPYEDIKFYTFTETKKVSDVKEYGQAVVSFQVMRRKRFIRIPGTAKLADDKMVHEEWRWWYLFYHP